MAKKTYTVASPEGANWAGEEEGSELELELEQEQETALIAAGWLAEPEKKKGGSK